VLYKRTVRQVGHLPEVTPFHILWTHNYSTNKRVLSEHIYSFLFSLASWKLNSQWFCLSSDTRQR